jgi:hypothetical protein
MLTLFSIPKPFRGHIAVIQRNAIRSWTLLRPHCEVVLFGDDEGVASAAADFGIRHVPNVARNEYGTPLVSDVFAQAERLAARDRLCYVNADIIVMNDLLHAVSRVRSMDRSLILGQRWDLDLTELWDFDDPAWETKLRAEVSARGSLHPYTGVDYFVFPAGLWGEIPPFAVGRVVYDNWLIWRARSLGVPVVDVTRAVTCVHQNHDRTYTSLGTASPDGTDDFQRGIEATRNMELAGGRRHVFTLRNSNWVLTQRWFLPALTPWYLWARLKSTIRAFLPSATVPAPSQAHEARADPRPESS